MNFMAPLASLLGLEIEHITDRVKRAVILNGAMAIFGLVAAGFLLAAGFMALAEQIGGINAALAFAAVFLLLALIVYAGMSIADARRKRAIMEKRRSSETGALLTTAALTAVPVLLRSPLVRTLGLPVAALAAFLVVTNSGSKDDD